MNVLSCCPGEPRARRPSFAVVCVLALALAGIAGVAHAAAFDEKLTAPMMKPADFKAQAQGFAVKYREISMATPAQLVTDASLAKQQFDLSWQLERSISDRHPPGDLQSMGWERLDNGGYSIDTRKYPEWRSQGDNIATLFNSNLSEGFYAELQQRGFRPEDVAAVKAYIAAHDLKRASHAATLPVALDFHRVVQKLDKAGKPVPDALVVSYWYQSTLAHTDTNRAWSEGLLKTLDAQRVRILLSCLSEMASTKSLIPENVSEGIAGTLAVIRLPDYEQRVRAEAMGDAP